MEENFKSKLGFVVFILIVLFLAIGGYFFMDYVLKDDNTKVEEKKKDYRINKKESYIYYNNESTLSESAEIYYRDVVINLDTQTTLNDSLKKENQIYKNTIKYINHDELISDDLIKYNNDDIYSMTFREYEDFNYNNYVSLKVNDFDYSCFDNITFKNTKTYVFDTNTGKLLTEEELLKKYNTDLNKVKEELRSHLEEKQTIDNDVEVIKMDERVNDLDKYGFYINNYGRLYISYLVKTTQVDYNDDMEVY